MKLLLKNIYDNFRSQKYGCLKNCFYVDKLGSKFKLCAAIFNFLHTIVNSCFNFQICYQSASDTNCFYIVDLGSGLGHLSRILNYGYDFKVCTIEAQKNLSDQAKVLDNEFEKNLVRKFANHRIYNKTVHLNWEVPSDVTPEEFWNVCLVVANAELSSFIINSFFFFFFRIFYNQLITVDKIFP